MIAIGCTARLQNLVVAVAIAVVMGLCFTIAPLSNAVAAPPPSIVNNGCPNQTGAAQSDCARLGAGETITIEALECGYSVGTDCSTNTFSLNPPTVTPPLSPPFLPPLPVEPSYGVCRTITNNSAISYFVPFKTPREWGTFLRRLPQIGENPYSAPPVPPLSPPLLGAQPQLPLPLPSAMLPQVTVAQCCNPQYIEEICPGVPCPVGSTDLNGMPFTGPTDPRCHDVKSFVNVGDNHLGRRVVGTPSINPLTGTPILPFSLRNYGAEGDVYPTIDTSSIFVAGNYKVGYTCSNGQWNKYIEEGSCVPVDGECNSVINGTILADGETLPSSIPGHGFCALTSVYAGDLAGPTPAAPGGLYTWTCNGTLGRPSASCSATLYSGPVAINGACAVANGQELLAVPATAAEKCFQGTEGILTGSGTQFDPWVWSCNGVNGGGNSNCLAYLQNTPFEGICGYYDGQTVPNIWWLFGYDNRLCNYDAGAAAPVVSGSSASWVCSGKNGGADKNCSASFQVLNGVCGVPSSFVTNREPATIPPTAADLPANACSGGFQPPTNIAYDSVTKTLSWTCPGQYGGSDTPCTISIDTSIVLGGCTWGPGGILNAMPTVSDASLCSNGGTVVGFSSSGSPLDTLISWTCQGNPSPANDLACNMRVIPDINGKCGASNGLTLLAPPTTGLCDDTITPPVVSGGPPGSIWSWSCTGNGNGNTPSCGANVDASLLSPPPPPVNGSCGTASGVAVSSAPSSNLCSVGFPSPVSGSGPWNWSCSGSNGGLNAACSAPALAAVSCGTTHMTKVQSPPTTNLCATGTPSAVVPNLLIGGYDWTCNGIGSVSCRALPCDVCSGTLPADTRTATLSTQVINYGSGTCRIRGDVTYDVTDTLVASNNTSTLSLAGAISGSLTYSRSAPLSVSPANYCQPCYRKSTNVTNGTFSVRKNGSCSTGTALDGGSTVSIPVDAFSIVP